MTTNKYYGKSLSYKCDKYEIKSGQVKVQNENNEYFKLKLPDGISS